MGRRGRDDRMGSGKTVPNLTGAVCRSAINFALLTLLWRTHSPILFMCASGCIW